MATRVKAQASANGDGASLEAQAPSLEIAPPKINQVKVEIVGTTPLIVHAWSVKAKQMMLEKQMGKAHKKKEPKDPIADYEASRYISDEGWDGVPAVAFKAAFVGACRSVDGLAMTLAKRLFRVLADGRSSQQNVELVRIFGEPRMREDMVRLESGVADIRYRAEYPEWSAILDVEFNAAVISATQLVNLIALAGYSEGICEWRPSAPKSATGSYGCWKTTGKVELLV
jgi:hypothetical protein